MNKKEWIGVDFDATLAHYGEWKGLGSYGKIIPSMLEKVKEAIDSGHVVKIMTARGEYPSEVSGIQDYLESHGLPRLEVTNKKDCFMVELWDDRARAVIPNTGHFESDILKNRIRDLEIENEVLRKKIEYLQK